MIVSYAMLGNFFVTLAQARVNSSVKRELIEKKPPPEWPVGKSFCLDFLRQGFSVKP